MGSREEGGTGGKRLQLLNRILVVQYPRLEKIPAVERQISISRFHCLGKTTPVSNEKYYISVRCAKVKLYAGTAFAMTMGISRTTSWPRKWFGKTVCLSFLL
jgi:hypothetical protein